jgi:ribonuclease HII
MDISYETKKISEGYSCVVGVDEVGRGSLAGPVVAAAVILDCSMLNKIDPDLLTQVKDSKQLTAKKREELAGIIRNNFIYSIGEVPQNIIDEINIHHATLLAIKEALGKLFLEASYKTESVHVAVDGKFIVPSLNVSQEAVVDGDAKIFSIAAASIIAKVFRDKLMTVMHSEYPSYNFAQHKGYGTLHHRNAIKNFGLSPVHRLSFCSHLIG